MEKKLSSRIMFVLALMGFLFSGYLTFSRLLLNSCPLNEPCAIFLGIPTCVYGFVMFTLLLMLSAAGAFWKRASTAYRYRQIAKASLAVSLAGIIFAGIFSVKELFFTECIGGACRYSLGLPSCTYGLVFFIAVFVLSLHEVKKR